MFSGIGNANDWMQESINKLKSASPNSHLEDARYLKLRAAAAGWELEATAAARKDRFWEQRLRQEERAANLDPIRPDFRNAPLPTNVRAFGGGSTKTPHTQILQHHPAMTNWDWKPGVGTRTVSLVKCNQSLPTTRSPGSSRARDFKRPDVPAEILSPRRTPRVEPHKSSLSLTHFGASIPEERAGAHSPRVPPLHARPNTARAGSGRSAHEAQVQTIAPAPPLTHRPFTRVPWLVG
mmetsp:Transcript_56738/g.123409  ORF Transcript_56738/g.123409 Transcript_56738/m.123409 type:complete len:237 (+) Transcript_56738:245-955(+)